MQAIVEILEKLESVIYKILIWFVLIPKTLLQIVLRPAWASTYIKDELDPDKGKSRFDEFFSPVVLLLVVALLPFVVWSFIPTPGVNITSPATDTPSANRTLDFDANIRFISSSGGYITTYWSVEQEVFNNGQYFYPILRQVKYTNNSNEINSDNYFDFYQLDNHTVGDYFTETFTTPGNYWVNVDASRFDADNNLIETYRDEIFVYVPDSAQDNVSVYAKSKPGETEFSFENIASQLKSEKTIFLALGLLIPPLLFALVIKLFSGAELTEDSLRETFYVQCYYFSPLAFMFWATRYAGRFLTPDVFFRFDTDANLIVLLPLILAVFWFISVQTHAISQEETINGWMAFAIVIGCMVVLILGILFIVYSNVPEIQDETRKISIWIYPLFAIGLLTSYHILANIRRRKEHQATDTVDNVLAGGIIVIILVTLGLVLFLGQTSGLTSDNYDATQQGNVADSLSQLQTAIVSQPTEPPAATEVPVSVENTATATLESPSNVEASPISAETLLPITPTLEQVVLMDTSTSTPEPQKFYTEDFNGTIDTWPYFLTQGDARAIHFKVDSGKLYVQLDQLNDSKPWFYLVNNAFTYTDVQVKAKTDNNGVNDNGVSLLCRYSSSGWYEFTISNSGYYVINAFDGSQQSYIMLASGASRDVNSGFASNVYTAVCNGNTLSLLVNGTQVATIHDDRFKDGQIGLGVASPDGLPVSVDFEYVEVSVPQ